MRERLNEIVARTHGMGEQVDVAIVYGSRAEEVLRFVRSNENDLIVLASHPIDASQPYRSRRREGAECRVGLEKRINTLPRHASMLQLAVDGEGRGMFQRRFRWSSEFSNNNLTNARLRRRSTLPF